MNFYKKIIIALIVIIFSYIFWRLIIKRNIVIQKMNKEPFSFNIFADPSTSESTALSDNTITINIGNLPSTYYSLPLMEFCIKGSYNSAYTGNYISTDILNYQLSRGCRFFDFEVYYIKNADSGLYSPQVGYSIDGGFITIDSTNTILLDNVLAALVSSGFSSQYSPNNADPLFINLRIKSNNNDIYKTVASSIHYALNGKLYEGTVTKNTPIQELMGKVILSIDKTINYNYKNYTTCDTSNSTNNAVVCYDLKSFINIESGGENMNLNRYANLSNQTTLNLKIMDNNKNTNVSSMNLILPDILPENAPNPDIKNYIINYGCQIVPFKFYKKDYGLHQYELLFNDNKGGIIPLNVALIYYKKLEQTMT